MADRELGVFKVEEGTVYRRRVGNEGDIYWHIAGVLDTEHSEGMEA